MMSELEAKTFIEATIKDIERLDDNDESELTLDSNQVQQLYMLLSYLLDTKFFDAPQ